MTSCDGTGDCNHSPCPHEAGAECNNCGEVHPDDRCPWLETCRECGRTGGPGTNIDMATDRLCCDCNDALERAEARRKADAEREAEGDYLYDLQKDREIEERYNEPDSIDNLGLRGLVKG